MAPAEGRLRAEGTLLHKPTARAFTEGSVFNEAGQLCAHATGTFSARISNLLRNVNACYAVRKQEGAIISDNCAFLF